MIWIDFLALRRNEAPTSCTITNTSTFSRDPEFQGRHLCVVLVPTLGRTTSLNDADEVNDGRRRTRCAEECNAASVISQPGPVRDDDDDDDDEATVETERGNAVTRSKPD
jgi:hypothetical protein